MPSTSACVLTALIAWTMFLLILMEALRVRNATALAWNMGVAVAAGSDMRYATSNLRQVADQVAELVNTGLPPMDAIKAATSTAAMCLELETSTGAIKPGLEADLVVLERDPLLDIGALHDVVLVINDGIVAIDRRGQIE